MNPLIPEAIEITKELGDVTFIGAVAVLLHVGSGRESQDLDFAILTPMSQEDLENKGYFTRMENGKPVTRTPRQYKIDIYSGRPIKRIPIQTIVETSTTKIIKSHILRFADLHILIVLKHRAGRPQDFDDLQSLFRKKYGEIRWEKIEEITEEVEYQNIRTAAQAMRG